MGTRGIMGHKINGKYYGTYAQYDTYPSGLGKDVIAMIEDFNREDSWETLKKNLSAVKFVNPAGDAQEDEPCPKY